MDKISDLFQKKKMGELILVVIFILYLIIGSPTPSFIGEYVNSLLGKLIIIIIIITMFMNTNPFLAILSLLVGFELIRRSGSNNMGIRALQKYAPSEEKKMSQFTAYNQFPYTLEQEVVKKMAPIKHNGTTLSKATYKPFLENLHDASPLNGTN